MGDSQRCNKALCQTHRHPPIFSLQQLPSQTLQMGDPLQPNSMDEINPLIRRRLLQEEDTRHPQCKNKIDCTCQLSCEEAPALKRGVTWNTRAPLVVSYHSNLPHLTSLIVEPLLVLHTSHWLQLAIPKPPIVAYLFTSAQLKSEDFETHQGSSLCNNTCCLACQYTRIGQGFTSTTTSQPTLPRNELQLLVR